MIRTLSLSRLLGLVCVLCFALSACVSVPVIQVSEQLQEPDLALGFSKGVNRDDGSFTEQVVLRGVLTGGGSFYSKLTVSNLANTDGRAVALVELNLPDGRRATYRERRERGEWKTTGERLQASVGAISFEIGLNGATVLVDAEDFNATISVASALPALRPKGGVYNSGGQWYLTTIPIPRGQATLKADAPFRPVLAQEEEEEAAQVQARETLNATGIAYAEHRAGNVPPYDLAYAWFNILHITEDETLVMSAFEKTGGESVSGRGHGWLFAANAQGLHLYEPAVDVWTRQSEVDETTNYLLPEVVFVADEARANFRGVIKTNGVTERKDDLDGLKRLERAVVRRFMQPWTFSFREAEYLLRKHEVGQSSHELKGNARFLYQQLRR